MKKILVANRGEIAIRVMHTAKKMGIRTVAIYSDIDREASHVQYADEAIHIGPSPSSQSYLNGDKIIAEAKRLNVSAIHPGYGFLSENAEFAAKVAKGKMTFIGPSVHAIQVMGSKLAAKEAVKSYNIPMVPGVDRAIKDPSEAIAIAKEIGYPILIKASAGGGGKGMRVVNEEKELVSQMNRAISEAESAFGDGSVFVEKYIESPRHIEVQILADTHGNTIHLMERECSIQRRHQKVMEEAPSSVLSDKLRNEMGLAAIQVAKSCQYIGAGTVEFLIDKDHNFYFLEMNTRLQVEHPVTELITGLDLVEQQILIARGEVLSISQEMVQKNGHALELRVYAEDPSNGFLPNVGTLKRYRRPTAEHVRVDDGYEEGMEIPIYYDPLIAKLITWGRTRELAIKLMKKAIANFEIEGVKTTLPFGSFVCDHPAFISGNFDTKFVEEHFSSEKLAENRREKAKVAAILATKVYIDEVEKLKIPENSNSSWRTRYNES